MDVHEGLAHIFPRDDALLLVLELLVLSRKQVKDLLDLVLFFGGDVVLFCEFGLARALGRGWGSTLLGWLVWLD